MDNLNAEIEAVLFLLGEPTPIKFLAGVLKKKSEEIIEAISILENNLQNRGICLMRKDEKIMLATSPQFSDTIRRIIKDKYEEELTKPMFETLAIILYKSPIKKSDIDFTRGVNSVFTLRNLLVKGLIEKKQNENKNDFFYTPSMELLRFLGVKNIEELPQKDYFKQKIEKFLSDFKNEF